MNMIKIILKLQDIYIFWSPGSFLHTDKNYNVSSNSHVFISSFLKHGLYDFQIM